MDTADVVVPVADAHHDDVGPRTRRTYTAHSFTGGSAVALYPRAPGDALLFPSNTPSTPSTRHNDHNHNRNNRGEDDDDSDDAPPDILFDASTPAPSSTPSAPRRASSASRRSGATSSRRTRRRGSSSRRRHGGTTLRITILMVKEKGRERKEIERIGRIGRYCNRTGSTC